MKNILITTLVLLLAFQVEAQENRRERIKSLKVAYLTEKLELTPEEAAEFWPAYNEYENLVFDLKASLGQTLREIARKDPEKVSEKEAIDAQKRVVALRKEIAQTEISFREYAPELLGAKKALYLDIYEERFKRELLKKLQDRRQGQKR